MNSISGSSYNESEVKERTSTNTLTSIVHTHQSSSVSTISDGILSTTSEKTKIISHKTLLNLHNVTIIVVAEHCNDADINTLALVNRTHYKIVSPSIKKRFEKFFKENLSKEAERIFEFDFLSALSKQSYIRARIMFGQAIHCPKPCSRDDERTSLFPTNDIEQINKEMEERNIDKAIVHTITTPNHKCEIGFAIRYIDQYPIVNPDIEFISRYTSHQVPRILLIYGDAMNKQWYLGYTKKDNKFKWEGVPTATHLANSELRYIYERMVRSVQSFVFQGQPKKDLLEDCYLTTKGSTSYSLNKKG